jgi:hypothetical protein
MWMALVEMDHGAEYWKAQRLCSPREASLEVSPLICEINGNGEHQLDGLNMISLKTQACYLGEKLLCNLNDFGSSGWAVKNHIVFTTSWVDIVDRSMYWVDLSEIVPG